MVRKTSLNDLLDINKYNLSFEAHNCKFEPLANDWGTLDGLNVHGAIGDEIHAHRDRELWDVLDTATGSRRNPLIVGITTAGEGDKPESLYSELKDYTLKVLEGVHRRR